MYGRRGEGSEVCMDKDPVQWIVLDHETEEVGG